MTRKFSTAAAVLALLSMTAPAHAATDDEAVNLLFSGGNQLVENIEFSTQSIPPF